MITFVLDSGAADNTCVSYYSVSVSYNLLLKASFCFFLDTISSPQGEAIMFNLICHVTFSGIISLYQTSDYKAMAL